MMSSYFRHEEEEDVVECVVWVEKIITLRHDTHLNLNLNPYSLLSS